MAGTGTDDVGNTDESDFHNRLGSIAWEKRDTLGALQGGATFEINLDPSDGAGIMTVVDNGANDSDPDAGQLLVLNALLGTYTITETVAPVGFSLDPDPTRVVTVSSGDLNAVVGTALGTPPGIDDPYLGDGNESDYHNPGAGEACSPGFWKTHATFDDPWFVPPTNLFGSVFNAGGDTVGKPDPLSGDLFSDITLLEAISLQGGGFNALARLAVSAYLDIGGGASYPMTSADLIAAVNAAFAADNPNAGNILTILEGIQAQHSAGTLLCPFSD
jgi:hypothetical protein